MYLVPAVFLPVAHYLATMYDYLNVAHYYSERTEG